MAGTRKYPVNKMNQFYQTREMAGDRPQDQPGNARRNNSHLNWGIEQPIDQSAIDTRRGKGDRSGELPSREAAAGRAPAVGDGGNLFWGENAAGCCDRGRRVSRLGGAAVLPRKAGGRRRSPAVHARLRFHA